MLYVEKKFCGFWGSCVFGEVESNDVDVVREKIREWLRKDEEVTLMFGEGRLVRWISYVKGYKGKDKKMSVVRVWEDCVFGEDVEVVLWKDKEVVYSGGKYVRK